MLSPQDEEFLDQLKVISEDYLEEMDSECYADAVYARMRWEQMSTFLRIVGELKKELDEANHIVNVCCNEWRKERDGLKEAIKEAKFIRCETPHDILVIPDGANPEDFSHIQNPCHNHRIMRQCEYLKPKP